MHPYLLPYYDASGKMDKNFRKAHSWVIIKLLRKSGTANIKNAPLHKMHRSIYGAANRN